MSEQKTERVFEEKFEGIVNSMMSAAAPHPKKVEKLQELREKAHAWISEAENHLQETYFLAIGNQPKHPAEEELYSPGVDKKFNAIINDLCFHVGNSPKLKDLLQTGQSWLARAKEKVASAYMEGLNEPKK